TRTTAPVTVRINAPEGVEIEGLIVNFVLEGSGSVDPVSVTIQNGQVQAIYTAGEITGFQGSQQTGRALVRINAQVDIPSLGRARGFTEFELIRQELTLTVELPFCGVAIPTGSLITIPFAINASTPEQLGATYSVQVSAQNGRVSLKDAAPSSFQFEELTLSNNPQFSFNYFAPDNRQVGEDRVCISLPDRPGLEEQCFSVVWSPPITELTRPFMRRAYWGQQEPSYPIFNLLTVDNAPNFQESRVLYQFQPFGYETEPVDGVWLQPNRDEDPIEPRTCYTVGANNRTYLEENARFFTVFPRDAWIAQWQFYAPGLAEPLFHEMVIAAFPHIWRRNQTVSIVSDVNGGNGVLTMLSGYQSDVLYGAGLQRGENGWEVLVKVWTPERFINFERRLLNPERDSYELQVASSPEAYRYYQTPNVLISFEGVSLRLNHISVETVDLNGEMWRAVYLRGFYNG
nr:hypothetical protein [Anaerolineae bacterium]